MRTPMPALIALCFPLAAAAAEPAVEVKLIKITADELEKVIASHKGKVVAIDIWADFCAPCKKAFPHLVKLHNEFAKDGLVCISLSKDDEESFDAALAFLKKQKATLANYILWDKEENKDALQKRFAHTAIPIFHVYGRDGKLVKTWDGDLKDEEIDKLIVELLKKK